jgi:hypothetical protein
MVSTQFKPSAISACWVGYALLAEIRDSFARRTSHTIPPVHGLMLTYRKTRLGEGQHVAYCCGHEPGARVMGRVGG